MRGLGLGEEGFRLGQVGKIWLSSCGQGWAREECQRPWSLGKMQSLSLADVLSSIIHAIFASVSDNKEQKLAFNRRVNKAAGFEKLRNHECNLRRACQSKPRTPIHILWMISVIKVIRPALFRRENGVFNRLTSE